MSRIHVRRRRRPWGQSPPKSGKPRGPARSGRIQAADPAGQISGRLPFSTATDPAVRGERLRARASCRILVEAVVGGARLSEDSHPGSKGCIAAHQT